ncbi:MAG: PmoA family protein [Bacteroidia bacterium]|nr:PmoA family protein [Bacteroidia bacterium]
MKKPQFYILLLGLVACASCESRFGTGMQASQDPVSGQITISDKGKPVLRYNYKTVYEKDALDTLAANKYIVTPSDTFMANPSIYAVARSNYIHPLYGPGGEVLTRDWSRDHPHHRGIYWAWPEVDFGSKRGDLHALQIVFARPTGKIELQNGPEFAQIEAENQWLWEDSVPIVLEVAVIRAWHSTAQGRIIDLAFRFVALKDSITIARRGTSLYGGLNVRMQTPKLQEISVFSDSSNVVPRRAWSDLLSRQRAHVSNWSAASHWYCVTDFLFMPESNLTVICPPRCGIPLIQR